MRFFAAIFVFVTLIHPAVRGQYFSLMDVSFSVDGADKSLAMAGGIIAPQVNMVDLNLDGIEDIVLFDREGDIFTPLIRNHDGSLSFEPAYRSLFPAVRTWILMRDFNGDGIKDIFCGAINIGLAAVEVYRGVIKNGNLSFELMKFPVFDFDLLYFPIGNIVTPVYVSVIDMPDIRDVDDDGDLDIISFGSTGSTVSLYKNMVIEQGLPLDTLVYVLEDNCFGGMVESGFNEEVTLSPVSGECGSSFWDNDEILADARHAGSTVLSVDVTGDNLQDLLLGDISYNGIVALTNTGTPDATHYTEQETRFPKGDKPVRIELFVSAFMEDVDNNGQNELIVAPNDRFASQTTDHIWRYNIAETSNGLEFSLVDTNFLLSEMVFPGPRTFPVFFDHNADGLIDIMVGTTGRSTDGISIDPRIHLYENQGSSTQPSYALVDDNYLQMAAFSTTSSLFAPAIGDLDGDGDLDIVIGDNFGSLYFLENTSNSIQQFTYAPPVYQAFGIKVGAHARPAIVDFNEDGLGDLVLGEQNFNSNNGVVGSLNYFENIGVVGSPNFNPDEKSSPNSPIWGMVNLKEPGFINNYSAPAIIPNGEDVLVASGSDQGFIHLFSYEKMVQPDSFNLISNRLGFLREGFRSGIAMADIDNDDFFEIAIGSGRGGMAIYNTDIKKEVNTSIVEIETESLTLSPNPVSDLLHIELNEGSDNSGSYWIYNESGVLVLRGETSSGSIQVSGLPPTVYMLYFKTKGRTYTSKFILVK